MKDTMTIRINHSSINEFDEPEWDTNCWELETFTNEHEFTGMSWAFQTKTDAVSHARAIMRDMNMEQAYRSVQLEVFNKNGQLAWTAGVQNRFYS